MSGFGFMAMGWWLVLALGFILFVVLAVAKMWDRPNRMRELDRRIEEDAQAGIGVVDVAEDGVSAAKAAEPGEGESL